MFYLIAATLPILYFSRDFILNQLNKERINNLSVKIGIGMMDTYSKIEFYAGKIHKVTKNYISGLYNDPMNKHTVVFVHNGEEIAKYKLYETKRLTFIEPAKYDFVLYITPHGTDSSNDETCVYRYAKYADIKNASTDTKCASTDTKCDSTDTKCDSTDTKCESTDTKCESTDTVEMVRNSLSKTNELYLLALRINLHEPPNTEFIHIRFDEQHIYMEGNVLFDRPFVKWVLNTKKNIKLGEDDTYTVSFINTNAMYVVVTDTECIKIIKGDYDVLRI